MSWRTALYALAFLALFSREGSAQKREPSTVDDSAARRPMQVDDLFRFDRVSQPEVSPNGQWIVYTVTKPDVKTNGSSSTLWLAATDGKAPPRQLTTTTKKDHAPRWSPDSRWIAFESSRGGSNQLWLIDVHGGEARPLTNIATEAGSAVWAPDGKSIAFVSAVWPEYSDKPYAEANRLHKERMDAAEKNPVKARVFTKLFFRHWDSWVEDKRQHLFVMKLENGQPGEPKNITPGDRDAFPTSSTFGGDQDYTFTPDGQFIIYTAPPIKDEAWSTNYDLWRVSINGGTPECLTKDNPAADGQPKFAPDGKRLAYRAMKRAGFEADQLQLYIVDCEANGVWRGKPKSVTANFDGSVGDYVWDADGKTIWFLAEDKGIAPLFKLDVATGNVEKDHSFPAGALSSLSISKDGRTIVVAGSTAAMPNEVYVCRKTPAGVATSYIVTEHNKKLLNELDLPKMESVMVPGAGGTPMQMWLLKPPGFDENKKWPLVYLVHGGPQGMWADGWSWRWNPQVWAAQGYVVALPNPRGSTGFGQKYVDEISGDWGGKCYEDLMHGVDWLEKQPYIDKDRMAAAGASFGGYMMNWFQGNTTRFKTLICHCGVFNHESMYTTTEELWFDEWEHGEGKPLWENRARYLKHSPHLKAANFKTPMLIIHNDGDFRVPVSQGIELFTTLQRLGIPSKFINFPDETHWVQKPANSHFWHTEIFKWLRHYVPPGGISKSAFTGR